MKEHIPFFSPIICMENSQSISKISQGFEVSSKQTWNVPKNLLEIFHLFTTLHNVRLRWESQKHSLCFLCVWWWAVQSYPVVNLAAPWSDDDLFLPHDRKIIIYVLSYKNFIFAHLSLLAAHNDAQYTFCDIYV